MAPPGQRYGYDLIDWVGLQRYRHLRQASEIRERHGCALHLDATCQQGRGGLFPCLDGWRGWVQHAARIHTGDAAALRDDLGHCLGMNS